MSMLNVNVSMSMSMLQPLLLLLELVEGVNLLLLALAALLQDEQGLGSTRHESVKPLLGGQV